MVGAFGEAGQEGGADLVFNEAALQPAGHFKKKVKIAKGHELAVEQKTGHY